MSRQSTRGNFTCSVRFQVLTASSMKMAVFYVVAPCSLVVYRRFKGANCLHHQGSSPCQTTRRSSPEDSHFHMLTFSQSCTELYIFKTFVFGTFYQSTQVNTLHKGEATTYLSHQHLRKCSTDILDQIYYLWFVLKVGRI
jgi:hypothetical protein